jgi:hypothetical protein
MPRHPAECRLKLDGPISSGSSFVNPDGSHSGVNMDEPHRNYGRFDQTLFSGRHFMHLANFILLPAKDWSFTLRFQPTLALC